MSLKSTYKILEEEVKITCRDPFLDREFFEKILSELKWPLDFYIFIEDVEEVTLDLSGLDFTVTTPSSDDEDPDSPATLYISSNMSTEVTLISTTETGLGTLFLEDMLSYNLSGFNGQGVERLVLDAPLEGLVVARENFPSPLHVVVRARTPSSLKGGPIQLRDLFLTGLVVGPHNGDVLLTRTVVYE